VDRVSVLQQPLLIGLGIGLIHAFDADHLTTLGSLAVRDRPRSALGYAARWACGHAVAIGTLGALALGVGMLWIASVSQAAEIGVALLLMALGANTLKSARRGAAAAVAVHASSATGPMHGSIEAHSHMQRSRWHVTGVLMGLLHGGAGSAAVLALLPLAGFDSGLAAAGFLLAFSLGVAVGALLFAALFSGLLAGGLRAGKAITTSITVIIGVLAIVVGAAMLTGTLNGG
jgi:cytochrome c biogenesis protein CcdA